MFKGFFKGRQDQFQARTPAAKDEFARGEASFAEALRRRSSDFDRNRAEILLAGGQVLHNRPTADSGREAAIQRLLHEGELRESMEYGAFPTPRTYRYTLTPRGEQSAEALRREAGDTDAAAPAA